MANKHRVLFVALTNDVGANRIVGAMAAAGMSCAVLSPPDFYSARSGLIARHFALPRQRGLWLALPAVPARLMRTCAAWQPDWIVPLDDMAALQLRSLAVSDRVGEDVRALLRRSLGDARGYAAALSRAGLMTLAAAEGVRIARTLAIGTLAEAQAAAEAIGYPLMLKLENTCGGAGVFPIATPLELEQTLARAGLGGGYRLKHLRVAAKQMVWRHAGLGRLDGGVACVQERIVGRLALRTVAAVEGRVLAGASFAAVAVHPEPTGASTVLKPIESPEMEATAARLTAALGASGFLSFDFLITPEGCASLIELNARPVGSTHLGALYGEDVCGAMAAHISGRPAPRTAPARVPDIEIALFPKELERAPASARLSAGPGAECACVHDVPWEDEPVIEAYLEHLERLHPSRIGEIRALMLRQEPRARETAETARRASIAMALRSAVAD